MELVLTINLDTPEAERDISMKLFSILESRVGSWIPGPTFGSDLAVIF